MAEEIIFKARVDTGNTVKEVDRVTKALEGVADAEAEVTKESINVGAKFEDIYGELQPLSSRLGEIEDRMYELALAGKQNTKEFQLLQQEVVEYRKTIISVDRAVDQLAEQGRGLGAALQLGSGIAAGYGAAQGAMALLGSESENFQNQLVKLQAVQATLASLEELKLQLDSKSVVLTKAKAAAQGIYTIAVGNSTGALKAFRVALLATGIGAIVAGIGLLIANWDSLTEAIGFSTKAQQLSNQVQKEAIAGISAELSASNKLSKVLKDDTVSREDKVQAVKDLQAEYPDLLSNVDAEKNSLDEINTALELNTELLKLNAQVKALESLRSEQYEKQLQAEVDAQTGANEGLINSIQAFGLGIDAKDLANKKSREVQIEAQKEINAIDKLTKQYEKEIEAVKLKGAVDKETSEDARKNAEEARKRQEAAQKAAEEAARKAEEEAQKMLERQRLIEDFMVASIDDESLRRLEQMRIAHQREREELVKKYGEDTELLKQLEAKQSDELTALNLELATKEADELNKINEQKRAAEQKIIDDNLKSERAELEGRLLRIRDDFEQEQQIKAELAFNEMTTALQNTDLTEGEKFKIRQQYLQKIDDLNAESAERNLKVEEEANKKRWEIAQNVEGSIQNLADTVFTLRMSREQQGSAEYEKLAKKQFKVNKAMQLGNAIIDGYKAVTASLSQSPIAIGAIPNPAGIASLAFAITTSLSNIAKIAATQYQGASSAQGGVTPPNVPTITGGQVEAPTTLTAGLEGSGQSNSKVVLVDSELKAGLEKSNKVEIISTIG